MFAALFISFVLLIIFSQIETFSVLVLIAGLTGFISIFAYLPTVTMVQERTDKDKLGRVMSIISLSSSGFEPIAFGLISILIAAALPIQTVLALSGGIGLLLTIVLIWKSKYFRQMD